ncbi:Sarcalumenin [Atta colombica]|uniref:Sarcalumenin n=1 Tax=Atta colombica TaxID=520822 RepID=A0A195B7L5_9HYME|nr:Sarcalumenin [Atta colombica]
MTGARMRPALVVGLFLSFLAVALRGVQCEDEQVPSEDLCRPYIEKALKDLGTGSLEQTSAEVGTEIDQENDLADDEETSPTSEETDEAEDDVSKEETEDKEGSVEERAEAAADESKEATEEQTDEEEKKQEIEEEQSEEDATDKNVEISTFEEEEAEKAEEASTEATEDEGEQTDSSEKVTESEETRTEEDEKLDEEKSDEETKVKDENFEEEEVDDEVKSEEEKEEADESQVEDEEQKESKEATEEVEVESNEKIETQQTSTEVSEEVEESDKEEVDSKTDEAESIEDQTVSAEDEKSDTEKKTQDESAEAENEEKEKESAEDAETLSSEDVEKETKTEEAEAKFAKEEEKEEEDTTASTEEETKSEEDETKSEEAETKSTEEEDTKTEEEDGKSEEEDAESEGEKNEDVKLRDKREIGEEDAEADESTEEVASDEEQEPTPEEDLIQEIKIPENLRPREHINQLLKLDEENEEKERAIQREADIILRDLKRLYDNAIKPLETMYKYRDLSNRHFGDPEIFSKPLVLFMGPWSGGKSSIINYLLDIEYKSMSLRTEEHCKSPNGKNDTGAEPSPAYFNIIMHGEEEEVLDGTQLAADWTFSGLQKFGQGLLDRLRGLRLNNKLLEKVNIVEIPGILEIRKQVQRLFPFNDACQWFIDRADIIFLVYDPAKLDVGPETEAILDQLKGREYQTRIILNKADQVKPEELMRVQGALIWNISPLMSSAEPPIMYSTSLWSLPYEAGAPIRLLYAQERAFLRDLRSAINKRVEHKIASARRFAVRVRNHAKMVDCYLTTYYNHKTFFGNKREISDKIIENPQDYHIYEGLSTLTNISRYDLPDPDVYRDFFRLNPLYDFPLLSSTCTYFRGCPINRLDVSIAYDLPELVGNYKKSVEAVLHENEGNSPPS